jgi:hypothetical protein
MPKKPRRPPVSTENRFKKTVADMGPAERWQHTGRTLEYTEQAGVLAARATEEHVLDRLKWLRIIDAAEWEAGLKLQEDYADARLSGRTGASYSGMRGEAVHGEFMRNTAQEAAYQRWRRAVRALPPSMQDCVIHTACAGMYPAPLQLAAVKCGLRKLAHHYGIPT